MSSVGWYSVLENQTWVGKYLPFAPQPPIVSLPLPVPRFEVGSVAFMKVYGCVMVTERRAMVNVWEYNTSNPKTGFLAENTLTSVQAGWQGPGYYTNVAQKPNRDSRGQEYRDVTYLKEPPLTQGLVFLPEPTRFSIDQLQRAKVDGILFERSILSVQDFVCSPFNKWQALCKVYGGLAVADLESCSLREAVWKGEGWYVIGYPQETSTVFFDAQGKITQGEVKFQRYNRPATDKFYVMYRIPDPKFDAGDVVADPLLSGECMAISDREFHVEGKDLEKMEGLTKIDLFPGYWRYKIGNHWLPETSLCSLSSVLRNLLREMREEMLLANG